MTPAYRGRHTRQRQGWVKDLTERQRMIEKTATMLEMQNEMNCRVDADWLARDREWYRAIWIECAELMDHYGGWKWWKHGETDIEQVMLEVVDIWHFGLSVRINSPDSCAEAAAVIVDEWERPVVSAGFLRDVESLAQAALSDHRFDVSVVPTILGQINRGFDDLYRSYVGKNVLNFFRQDHGYRDGSYRKTWDGREDNLHLVEVVAALNSDADGFRGAIYDSLNERYRRYVSRPQ